MPGTPDYFILQIDSQIDKVITISGNPHNQVPVFAWFLLRFAQGFGIDNIELNMMAIHFEIGSNQLFDLFDAGFIREKLWRKFLI